MEILNLAYKNKSTIDYRVLKFPDGQQQIEILSPCGDEVYVRSRLNNFMDLELIICATKSLRALNPKASIGLYVPYFLGARSDRQFHTGSNNYLRDVICPIINSMEFTTVEVVNAHSDVLEACIPNLIDWGDVNITESALIDIGFYPSKGKFICPDSGALKKITKTLNALDAPVDFVQCTKYRAEDGALSNIAVYNMEEAISAESLVILDDICDGGRTFINLATHFRKSGYTGKMFLYVTHGIFSRGTSVLMEHFDGVYCTNSYSDLGDVWSDSVGKVRTQKVKQYNIF